MTTEHPPPLGADASFESASKPLKPHVRKTDFIEKSICNDASAPLGCFSLTPNLGFQVSAIRNFYFGIGRKKSGSSHKSDTKASGFPRGRGRRGVSPRNSSVLRAGTFTARRDHERSLSSAGSCLGRLTSFIHTSVHR